MQVQDSKPTIGITLGNYNGIGPTVIIKALANDSILKYFTPVIYGAPHAISYYRDALNTTFHYFQAASIQATRPHKVNIIQCSPEEPSIVPGKITEVAAKHALQALQKATEDLKSKQLDAIVTAPIHQQSMKVQRFKFTSHTKFFQKNWGAKDCLKLMVAEELRIGIVTSHVPLQKVAQRVTKERLESTIHLLHTSLQNDFGISKPQIAVLGLNPHAGEEGLVGKEEQNIISPVINAWKEKGKLIFGPYAADSFFGKMLYRKFDGVLAMYHDQGLISFKTLAFERGVNFTAGLPIIHTSPDHGAAFELAAKNQADECSMRAALFLALEVIKQRVLGS